MKWIGFEPITINNGLGIRTSIYITGCNFNCKNCFNAVYHDYNIGDEFIVEDVIKQLTPHMNKHYINGISFAGPGDPLNRSDDDLQILYDFILEYKRLFKDKDIWIFSGFTYEQAIKNNYRYNILKQCDVMVDGQFIDKLKDITLPFRGSKNQRIIDIQKTIQNNNIIVDKQL